MTIVLGLNGYGGVGADASAALVDGATVVAAVEEERLIRVKRAPGAWPLRAAREVVEIAGIAAEEIDVLAYGWLPEAIPVPRERMREELLDLCRRAGVRLRSGVAVRFFEHHAAHASSGLAFVPPDLRGGTVAALVLDGAGESTSGGLFHLTGGRFVRDWYLELPSSLGILYEGVTRFLGFGEGEEGKTMGLAAYGCGRHEVDLPEVPDRRGSGPLPVRPDAHRNLYPYLVRSIAARLEREHGDGLSFTRRAEIAAGAQRLLAERILGYLDELLPGIDVLVWAGGVALNCSVNGLIAERCRRHGVGLVVPPPAGDAGISIGAAVAAADEPAACLPAADFALGRAHDPGELARALELGGQRVERVPVEEVARRVVERDAVCGWYAGRAEVGPRALGRRCIVARPDSTRLRDRINLAKGRESWRPLAPSVTAAEFSRSFEGTPSPHMLVAATVCGDALGRLAGVVHVDNSSRPQVLREDGPYLRLLAAVGRLTGTEAVVCTSFNQSGEPMVYRPAEAVAAAQRMGLDLLAGDGWCVALRRHAQERT